MIMQGELFCLTKASQFVIQLDEVSTKLTAAFALTF